MSSEQSIPVAPPEAAVQMPQIDDTATENPTLIEQYRYALAWCSAADDFLPDGKAREGWEKIVQPLLAAENSDDR